MADYTYPGVYIVEVETTPKPIPGVPTGVSDFMSRETIAAIGGLLERLTPEWSRASQPDPGVTLLELAAWIAESVLFRNGSAPDAAARAATRLAVASLALASDRQAQGGSIDRARYYPGVLLDQGKPITDADDGTCLRIVRKPGDPLRGYKYRLSIDGMVVAGFGEVEGLSWEQPHFFDMLLRRLGKLLGLRKLNKITFKRGIVADPGFADWYRNAGHADRRDVVIRQSEPRADVQLVDARITRIEGPALNGSSNDVAIETLELACEAICLCQPA